MAFDPSTAKDVFDPATASNVPGEFIDPRIPSDLEEQEKRMAQYFGGAAGAIKPGLQTLGSGIEAVAQRVRGTPTPTDEAIEAAKQQRVLQGTGAPLEGTTGRQRMGFNEITHQQAERAKQEAALIEQLRQKGIVARTAGQTVADFPDIGSTESGVLFPKKAAVPIPEKMSGLDQIKQMFLDAAKKGVGATAQALRFVSPPLAAASLAGEAADIKQQIMREPEQRDPVRMGLSGLGMLGAGAALASPVFPKATIPGLAISAAVPVIHAMREHQARMETDPEYAERYREALSRMGQRSAIAPQ